ncbi:hypothetical protein AAY473_005374 [Plecturocebus cupreus]
MGPAEPVRPVYSALGSAVPGAGKRAAPAKRVVLATRVASLPGLSRSVGNKNSSEIPPPPRPGVRATATLGDYRQRSHTGRQCDSFGRRGYFAGAPARCFSVWSTQDGRARLVPSPQGTQQLEALRTESLTASTANPGRSGSVGKGRPPKEN